jgi:hypothetical protein
MYVPTHQRPSSPKLCPPLIFRTSICIFISSICIFHIDGWSAMMFFHALVKGFILFGVFKMLELLKFAKKYPVADGGSFPIIDVCQATYYSPSSTAWSASSSQGYHSSTLVQARGPNRFQSVSTSTDQPPIQSKNGPAACSPGSNTSPQAKAGRKRNYSRNSSV